MATGQRQLLKIPYNLGGDDWVYVRLGELRREAVRARKNVWAGRGGSDEHGALRIIVDSKQQVLDIVACLVRAGLRVRTPASNSGRLKAMVPTL